ncbi:hypothetical protein TNCT_506281 [Trichonephila clavata]|uniref:Reverse transcriptase/retrotransposon-derived protein RNase H-like domain-containing protein n=1 Tax=Trichonephila clavata TaxID=2740835 RepID=A0A8X6H5H1_TRICU|nr:hypothetical protein TNCT_506281 [Trichonephila clavata]
MQQANNLLSIKGSSIHKKNNKTALVWTLEAEDAFHFCKHQFKTITYLSHPSATAPIALMCDVSDRAIGS